jgi:MFS family permease
METAGGAIIGSAAVSYLSDVYGRRMAMFVGAVLASLGAALQGGGVAIAMLIAGRFIAGVAIGLMSATVPVYCVRVPSCLKCFAHMESFGDV